MSVKSVYGRIDPRKKDNSFEVNYFKLLKYFFIAYYYENSKLNVKINHF